MSDIGKGDWVECADASESLGLLKEGRVYFVEGLSDWRAGYCYQCSLAHDGDLIFADTDYAWCPTRFRPLKASEQATTRRSKTKEPA